MDILDFLDILLKPPQPLMGLFSDGSFNQQRFMSYVLRYNDINFEAVFDDHLNT